MDECPFCSEPRRISDRTTAVAKYQYIPLEHRLRLAYAHPQTAAKLQNYRQKFRDPQLSSISDVWGGSVLRSAKMKDLFEGDDDCNHVIILQFSLDGVQMHKTGQNKIWPLICLNLNLPLTEHFREDSILPIGIIPGPQSPSDLDSFLYPFITEARQLSSTGVRECYDGSTQTYFRLRVHVVLCTGDTPAIAKLLRMKSATASSCCRFCNIQGSIPCT